ncbi:hypothetical protein Pogu_0813 [Pyrobaculum oguniense TE7]|uniref:Uncharacterized protein n=1 Tax=Pyrobaculum oguniense (strain DSM 13380 / JCM 10595 / TE7) TaxID=698757 RepID=H6Q9K6_PYROT|nr:hypothetical protein Pogu_0813 [Pyrobaculum oguniense TE7]
MSKWVRYISLLVPLLGIASPWHELNVALLPFIGGVIYGYFTDKRRGVAIAPVAALVPVAVVLAYYGVINGARLIRFISIFPLFVWLWVIFWAVFFTLGAVFGYVIRPRAPNR